MQTFSDVFVVISHQTKPSEACAVYTDAKNAAIHAEQLVPDEQRVQTTGDDRSLAVFAGGDEGYPRTGKLTGETNAVRFSGIEGCKPETVYVLLGLDGEGYGNAQTVSNDLDTIFKEARQLAGDPANATFHPVPVPDHGSEFTKLEIRDGGANGDLIGVITGHYWDGYKFPRVQNVREFKLPPPPAKKCAICQENDERPNSMYGAAFKLQNGGTVHSGNSISVFGTKNSDANLCKKCFAGYLRKIADKLETE